MHACFIPSDNSFTFKHVPNRLTNQIILDFGAGSGTKNWEGTLDSVVLTLSLAFISNFKCIAQASTFADTKDSNDIIYWFGLGEVKSKIKKNFLNKYTNTCSNSSIRNIWNWFVRLAAAKHFPHLDIFFFNKSSKISKKDKFAITFRARVYCLSDAIWYFVLFAATVAKQFPSFPPPPPKYSLIFPVSPMNYWIPFDYRNCFHQNNGQTLLFTAFIWIAVTATAPLFVLQLRRNKNRF